MKRISFVLVFLFTASFSIAETITLKSGKIIEGEIIEKTDEYIKIESGEQVLKVRFSMMDEQTINLLEKIPYQIKNEQTESDVNNDSKEKSNEYISLGDSHFNRKNYKEAIEHFRKAVELNPKLDYGYQMIGNCSAALENWDDALLYAKKAIEINSENVTVHSQMGYYYYALQQYDDSIKEFKLAIKLAKESDSNLYFAYKGLGDSYSFVEDSNSALEAYKRAADIQPNVELFSIIAHGLAVSGEFQEAVVYMEKAEAMDANNPFILAMKGGYLTFLKRFDSAEEVYQKAMDIFRQNGNKEGIKKMQSAMKALKQIKKEQR